MQKEIYLDLDSYDRLIDAMLATMFDRLVQEGRDTLKITLGEIAGIWPNYCRETLSTDRGM